MTPVTLHNVPNLIRQNTATLERSCVWLGMAGKAIWLQIPYWVHFTFKVKNIYYMCIDACVCVCVCPSN